MSKRPAKYPADPLRRSKRGKKEVELVFGTKIKDIDNDCLVHIFENSDLQDLLNCADSTKCFKDAADLTYTSKYRKHKIVLEPSLEQSTPEITDHVIKISYLPTCLKMLRRFGHLITHISISYARINERHQNDLVDEYLNKYCANSLEKIELSYTHLKTMDKMKNIFSKVKCLTFRRCELGNRLTDFNDWFPKLQSLSFQEGNFVANRKCIEEHIPNLRELVIHILESDRYTFDELYIREALRLNPAIQTLVFVGDILDTQLIQDMEENLQSVTTLIFTAPVNCFNCDGTIHLKNLENLRVVIIASRNEEENNRMPRIPFTCDRLVGLELKTLETHFRDDVFNFIRTQPSLEKLFLKCLPDDHHHHSLKYKEDIIELVNSLSSLKMIVLEGNFTIDEIRDIAERCRSYKFEWFEFIFFENTIRHSVKLHGAALVP